MIKFYKDDFDSNIFGENIYKLFVDKKIESKSTIVNLLKNKDFSHVHCFTIFENSNIEILNKLDFRLISIRNIYKRILTEAYNLSRIPKGFHILKGSEKQIKLTDKEILSIANVIGGTSRYFKDTELPREKSTALYLTWIKNSLYQDYADESFILFKDRSLAGMITLKIKREGGYIDLIGVEGRFQNKGLGGVLLEKGVEYLLNEKIKNMYVVTEGENLPAISFYQKNNFILNDIQLVYHKSS